MKLGRLIYSAKFLLYVFTVVLLSAPLVCLKAEVYKWTDDKGVVHYGDQPPNVEEPKVADINQSSVVTAQKPAQRPSQASEDVKPPEVKRVIMYATSWCPYCEKARKYFAASGIKYTEYDVEASPRRMREFKQLGGAGYPLILIGDNEKMQGFSIKGFERRYNR
ncbi:glutaredoxin family protein [Shewanella sedimentimangrovi]|uniref:Glutaredoxin family protein n=1 Tax=Shewanella sedimentimangrovi TaxID=2814293 RepID=A0ABX7R3H7_9GAMM|nr:glutaredoxin family protein [Shewanella sedimentimangrovi]QSX38343.1 glutaredoxin family protein [Shewanella sedimentimangrovi]